MISTDSATDFPDSYVVLFAAHFWSGERAILLQFNLFYFLVTKTKQWDLWQRLSEGMSVWKASHEQVGKRNAFKLQLYKVQWLNQGAET